MTGHVKNVTAMVAFGDDGFVVTMAPNVSPENFERFRKAFLAERARDGSARLIDWCIAHDSKKTTVDVCQILLVGPISENDGPCFFVPATLIESRTTVVPS